MNTILFIDDDEHYAWLIQRLLCSRGFSVQTAQGELEGMDKARELQPDLILVDLYLPRMGDLGLIKNLKEEARVGKIPIVVISPLPKDQSQQLVQGVGVQDVLARPFRLTDLLGTVRKNLPVRGGPLDETVVH